MLTYLPGNGLLHRADPVLKLLFAIAQCALVFAFPTYYIPLAVIALNIGIGFYAGAGKWALRTVYALFKFSLLLFVIQLLSISEGRVIISLTKTWKITREGLSFSLLLVLRIISGAMPIAMILRVTKALRLADSLNKHLKIPYKYAFALSSAIRFIPIFTEEMAEIIEAQTARGVELDTKNVFKKIKLLAPLCVPLLLSSVRKIETATISAELRGIGLRK